MVARNMTTPTTPEARSEFVLLVRPRDWKMKGA
jgi:hypothetical protein